MSLFFEIDQSFILRPDRTSHFAIWVLVIEQGLVLSDSVVLFHEFFYKQFGIALGCRVFEPEVDLHPICDRIFQLHNTNIIKTISAK